MNTFGTGFVKENDLSFESHNRFSAPSYSTDTISYDLSIHSIGIHNQGKSSSCVANAMIKALEICRVRDHGIESHVKLSRLALYYMSRQLMDPPATNIDRGTFISTAANCLRKFGVCRENKRSDKENDKYYWPFETGDGTLIGGNGLLYTAPPWLVMREAYMHKVHAWYTLSNKSYTRVEDCVKALSYGCPIVAGFKVGDEFRGYNGGVLQKTKTDQLAVGYHAMCIVGWDKSGHFIVENSYGEKWGPYGGYLNVSSDIIESNNDSFDFVVITSGTERFLK